MATKLEGSIKRWIGLSSDRKPGTGVDLEGVTVVAADIPVGSSFLESDTGQIFRWTGSAWIAPTIDTRVAELLAQMLDELTRLRKLREFLDDTNSDDLI